MSHPSLFRPSAVAALLIAVAPGLAAGAAAPRWKIRFHFADDMGRYASAYAKIDGKPSIMRALRTKDFLYIRNFKPDRMPAGDPKQALTQWALDSGAVEEYNRIGFADIDQGPTQTWIIAHRGDPKWQWFFDRCFGRRPGEELYDLSTDLDQVRNGAEDPGYAQKKGAAGNFVADGALIPITLQPKGGSSHHQLPSYAT